MEVPVVLAVCVRVGRLIGSVRGRANLGGLLGLLLGPIGWVLVLILPDARAKCRECGGGAEPQGPSVRGVRAASGGPGGSRRQSGPAAPCGPAASGRRAAPADPGRSAGGRGDPVQLPDLRGPNQGGSGQGRAEWVVPAVPRGSPRPGPVAPNHALQPTPLHEWFWELHRRSVQLCG